MENKRTYIEWCDFGEGKNTYEVRLDYRQNREYIIDPELENKIMEVWVDSCRDNSGDEYTNLHNGRLFNLKGIEDRETDNHDETIIKLGPGYFRDYHSMERFLNNGRDPDKYGISEENIKFLRNEIHPLSSFPAVLTNDEKIVLGKKGRKTLDVGTDFISFPGAGYLDRYRDRFTFEGVGYTKKPGYLVAREIKEEMNIKNNEIKNITFTGIWEDVFEGSHWNPGLFSMVEVELSGEEVSNRKDMAKDAWETEGPYILAPTNKSEFFNEFIKSTFEGEELSKEVRREVKGLGEIKSIQGTGKAELMLLRVGRQQFGQGWYEDKLDEYENIVEIKDKNEL